MKYIIFFLTMLSTPLLAQTQPFEFTTKQIICADSAFVINSLAETYGEVPVWFSTNEDGGFIMLQNKQTLSWSLLLLENKKTCLVAVGKNQKQF